MYIKSKGTTLARTASRPHGAKCRAGPKHSGRGSGRVMLYLHNITLTIIVYNLVSYYTMLYHIIL